MSRLIVIVHPRQTGPGFTPHRPPSRGETGGAGRGVHFGLLKKGRWEWGESVVSAFHSAAWSMGWFGSNVAPWRHLVGNHVKVPNLVQLLLLLFLLFLLLLLYVCCFCCFCCMYVVHPKRLMIVLRCAKAGCGRRTSSS